MRSIDKVKLEIAQRSKESLLQKYMQECERLESEGKTSSAEKRILSYRIEVVQKQITRLEALASHGDRALVDYEAELLARMSNHEESIIRCMQCEENLAFAIANQSKYDVKIANGALRRERSRCGALKRSVDYWEARKALFELSAKGKKNAQIQKSQGSGAVNDSEAIIIETLRTQFGGDMALAAEQALKYQTLTQEEKNGLLKPYDYSTKTDLRMFANISEPLVLEEEEEETPEIETKPEEDNPYKPLDASSINDVLDQPFEL